MSTPGNKSYFLPQIIICENGDEDYGIDTQSSTNDDEEVRREDEEEEDNIMINTQDNNQSPSNNEATDQDPPVVPSSAPQTSDPTGTTALAENLSELRLGNNNHDTDTTAALMMSTIAPVITTSAESSASSSEVGGCGSEWSPDMDVVRSMLSSLMEAPEPSGTPTTLASHFWTAGITHASP